MIDIAAFGIVRKAGPEACFEEATGDRRFHIAFLPRSGHGAEGFPVEAFRQAGLLSSLLAGLAILLSHFAAPHAAALTHAPPFAHHAATAHTALLVSAARTAAGAVRLTAGQEKESRKRKNKRGQNFFHGLPPTVWLKAQFRAP